MTGTTRKLQKVGGGTYTVSIPKEWATDHDLAAGDQVRLFPDGEGSLVICPAEGPPSDRRQTVRVDGEIDEALEVALRAAYAAGLQRVEVHPAEGVTVTTRRRIDRAVRDRTGMRITEESETAVTVETVLDDREVSLERSVVQLQFVTLSVFRTAVDLALDAHTNGAERIDDRRCDASALAALVTRQFERSLSQPGVEADLDLRPAQAFDCYRTARALDRVADHAVGIQARGTLSLDAATTDRYRSLADAVRLYVEEATTTVVDGDDAGADLDALRTARDELTAQFDDAANQVAEDPATARLHWLLQTSAERGDRIATVAREAALRRQSVER